MAVAHDAASTLGSSTSTQSWTHTPVGTPKGVLVVVAENASSDGTSGVTYGGAALSNIASGVNSSPEAGRVTVWFLGSGLSTGAQTVQVTRTNSNAYIAAAYTVTTTTYDTVVVDSDSGNSGNISNVAATMTIPSGLAVYIAAGLWSGEAALTSITDGTGMTRNQSVDFGAQTAVINRRGNYVGTGSADTPITWTQSSDDAAYAAVAIRELDPNATFSTTAGAATAAGGSSVFYTNLIPQYDDQSIEGGIGSWQADGGSTSTVTQSTTQVRDGTYSLKVTCSSTADAYISQAYNTAYMAPVTAGDTYTSMVSVWNGNTSNLNCLIEMRWYTSGGTYLSTSNNGYGAVSASAWSDLVFTATAPATAAYCHLRFALTGNSGADQFVDRVGVFAGTRVTGDFSYSNVSGAATFTTLEGTSTAAGGTTSFTGDGTFSSTAGAATAAGGSSTFRVDNTFTTLAGDAPAAGGTSSFTGTATFGTTAGDAPASGGSTTFRVDETFTTTVGDAPASGGVSTFTGGTGGVDGTFTTLAGAATAAGGATSFTGDAAFTTTVGDAPAAGGSSTFTGGATFTSVVGDAPASGGSTSFTGDGSFTTTVGDAPAAGGTGSFTTDNSATFTTVAGDAGAAGGSTSFTGGATMTTVQASATAGGGVSSVVHTFTPAPVSKRTDARWFNDRLQGVSVWKKTGVWHERQYPSQIELDGADLVYLGGRKHVVTADEAAALAAEGYAIDVEVSA